MKKDTITEMLTGQEGAFKVIGKVVTTRAGAPGDKPMTLVLGLMVGDLNEPLSKKDKVDVISKSLNYQMWEGEFIFLPRRVYQGRKGEGFNGLRADQILTSTWGHAEKWLNKIFDINESKNTKS